MDSALLIALVFAAIVVLLIIAALVVRASSTEQDASSSDNPREDGSPDHLPRAAGQSRAAGAPGAAVDGHVHRDPDPDRLAGGRASTHPQ
jgi:hypothetical protein